MPRTKAPILEVYSRRFIWTAADGFAYRPGSEQTYGLNRTRRGADKRIAKHLVRNDGRVEAFLATLFDDETYRSLGSMTTRFTDGDHMVNGVRYDVREVVVGP